MPDWKYTLDVKDVFRKEDLTFDQKRDIIVGRIRAEQFRDPSGHLDIIVDELAGADNLIAFDAWWDEFYDWAADNRVRVATF